MNLNERIFPNKYFSKIIFLSKSKSINKVSLYNLFLMNKEKINGAERLKKIK